MDSLKDFFSEYDLQEHNIPYTRITPTTESNIDIYVHPRRKDVSIQTHQNQIFNHLAMSFELYHLNKANPKPIYRKTRSITEENLRLLKNRLKLRNWDDVLTSQTVHQKYNFINILQYEMDQIMPHNYKQIKNQNKKHIFWDEKLITPINVLSTAQDKYIVRYW
jgi:hypothetical protein